MDNYFTCFLILLSVAFVSGKQLTFSNPLITEQSVAIIGGGAAGTSTAFWLRNTVPKIQTTIYEKSNSFGGRSTTVEIKNDGDKWGSIELGASIFVEANKNLMKATETFGLKKSNMAQSTNTKNPGLGVWNGKEFVFQETGTSWDKLKFIWRYGILSPFNFQKKQKEVVEKFMKLYEDHKGFNTIEKLVKMLNIQELTNQTATNYLDNLGISKIFSQEILQSATRGNYAQNLNELHPFALMVSMEAGHGTWTVETGNFRIFEQFAIHSKADIQLNTKVIAIHNITEVGSNGKKIQRYLVETSKETRIFDHVVLSSPLVSSDIQFDFQVDENYRNYHTVHVTLVAGYINYDYFKKNVDNMPTFIVTTGYPLVGHFKKEQAPFYTFSIQRNLDNGESVVKIFSPQIMKEKDLDLLFLNSSWVYRKMWQAFPKLQPVDLFPEFVLKENKHSQNGIIYTGAFESFISTMETQTMAGKNAARLIYEKSCHYTYCLPFGDGWGNL